MESTQPIHQYIQEPYSHIQANDKSRCRLCWQEEGELISPCRCAGHQAFVHEECLANQIETARIMKVANVDGIYNSRCQLCKFHIQFKVQEYPCSFNTAQLKDAFKSLDEDTAVNLSLSLPIIVVLFSILLVIISGHIQSSFRNPGDSNIKYVFLQILLVIAEYFLVRNVAQKFPTKIRRPVLTSSNPMPNDS